MKQDTLLDRAGEAAVSDRFASVERVTSYLTMPLNWKLRIWGQGVGGYAKAEGASSRYATRERAEQVAQVWMRDGIYPAHQSKDRNDER